MIQLLIQPNLFKCQLRELMSIGLVLSMLVSTYSPRFHFLFFPVSPAKYRQPHSLAFRNERSKLGRYFPKRVRLFINSIIYKVIFNFIVSHRIHKNIACSRNPMFTYIDKTVLRMETKMGLLLGPMACLCLQSDNG